MNVRTFICCMCILLFLLSGCQGDSQDESAQVGLLSKMKNLSNNLQKRIKKVPREEIDQATKEAEIKANIWMMDYLTSHQFDIIEEKIRIAEKAYSDNPENEKQLSLYWGALRKKKTELEPYFNAYVEKYSKSHIPYLARGIYYIGIAWLKRGDKSAILTSKSQFEGMKHYLKLAEQDLYNAKKINPEHPHICSNLITLYKGQSADKKKIKEVFDEGLSHNPYSYDIRSAYLGALLPRWHGSIEEMQKVIDDTQKYIAGNKRLNPTSCFL